MYRTSTSIEIPRDHPRGVHNKMNWITTNAVHDSLHFTKNLPRFRSYQISLNHTCSFYSHLFLLNKGSVLSLSYLKNEKSSSSASSSNSRSSTQSEVFLPWKKVCILLHKNKSMKLSLNFKHFWFHEYNIFLWRHMSEIWKLMTSSCEIRYKIYKYPTSELSKYLLDIKYILFDTQ